jgi:hypothetical protein
VTLWLAPTIVLGLACQDQDVVVSLAGECFQLEGVFFFADREEEFFVILLSRTFEHVFTEPNNFVLWRGTFSIATGHLL